MCIPNRITAFPQSGISTLGLGEVEFVHLTYPPEKIVPLSMASSASLYPADRGLRGGGLPVNEIFFL